VKIQVMLLFVGIVACSTSPSPDNSSLPDSGKTSPSEDSGFMTADAGDFRVDSGAIVIDCKTQTKCGVLCVDLESDPDNCGSCGRTCVIPHASAACATGECGIDVCEPGFYDRDQEISNGCEFEDQCIPDEDCNTSCQSVGVSTCSEGVMSCWPPMESCNAADDDCDGQCDNGLGCRHGIHRGSGNGHIFSDDIGTVERSPYQVEARNYFYLYVGTVPGTRPVFLCRKSNGLRFLTSRTDCDMNGARERRIGFVSPTELCDSIPLYQLHHGPTNNHFYTRSAGERDNAVNNLGYTDLGVFGHVWLD
jgi:hypothetical protein